MADNTTLQSATPATAPAGLVVAGDDAAGVFHQRVKPTWGTDGVANDVNATTPLPVTIYGPAGQVIFSTARLMADNLALPTAPDVLAHLMVHDGATQDMVRSVSAISDGGAFTGVLPTAIYGANAGSPYRITAYTPAAGITPAVSLSVAAVPMLYNGATSDPARGDITNGLDVDVTRLPAGEAHIGAVGSNGDIVDVTLTLDTSAYASGDLLADTQSFVGVRVNGGRALLQSLTIIDEDDQGMALTVFFLNANNTLGTENAAPSITDANARDILGWVDVGTGDYKDLGGVRIACIRGIGLMLEATGATTNLFLAVVNGTGAPTYTASGLKLKLGLTWD